MEPWRMVLVAFLVLFFRRLPVVVLLKPAMPAIKTYREAVFSGWFGPIGVGAVFLSTIAKEELETVYEGKEKPLATQIVGPVVLFIVFSSVVIHGTTVPLFKLGRTIRTRTVSVNKPADVAAVSEKADHQDDQERDMRTADEKKDEQTLNESTILVKSLENNRQVIVDMHASDFEYPEEDFLPDDVSDAIASTKYDLLTNTASRSLSSVRTRASGSKTSVTFASNVGATTKLVEPPKHSTVDKKKKPEEAVSLKTWFFRSNSASRIQKRRRQKEKERKRRIKEDKRILKEKQKEEKRLLKERQRTGITNPTIRVTEVVV